MFNFHKEIPVLAKKTNLKTHTVSLIKKALKNKSVKNVGIFGPYGSGKSSAVGSFLNSIGETDKAIFFSSLIFENCKKSEIKEIIYKEILSFDVNNANLHEYIKKTINQTNKAHVWSLVLFIIAFIVGGVFLGFYLFQFLGWVSILIGIISSLLLISFLLILWDKQIEKLEFELNDTSFIVQFKNKKTDEEKEFNIFNSPFIENALASILKARNIKYLVIEDLERIRSNNGEKILIIDYLQEFKLLNDVLNRNKKFVNNPIIFFYGLKDGCFDSSEKRTKFFDMIIPVIPHSSTSNSHESILESKEIKKYFNNESEIIYDFAPYFINQRQINSLFVSFESIVKSSKCDEQQAEEAFALSCMNVLFPKMYSSLFETPNILDSLLRDDRYPEFSFSDIETCLDNFTYKIDSESNAEALVLLREKNNAVLFLKTCISKKYLTFNYENLLCYGFESALSSNDNSVLKRLNADEDISYNQIDNPGLFIKRFKRKLSILENRKYFNPFLIRELISCENYRKEIAYIFSKMSYKNLSIILGNCSRIIRNEEEALSLINYAGDSLNIIKALNHSYNISMLLFDVIFNSLDFDQLATTPVELKTFLEKSEEKAYFTKNTEIIPDCLQSLITQGVYAFSDVSIFDESYFQIFRNYGGFKYCKKIFARFSRILNQILYMF